MSNQETRVVSKRSYKYWGLVADIITPLTLILYITFTYSIFKKSSMQVTAIFWIVLIILISALKNIIVNFVLDLRKHQSAVSKRATRIVFLSLLGLLLVFNYLWLKDLIILLFVFVLGQALSMYPYYKYNKNKDFYDKVKGISKDEEIKQDLKDGKLVIK